MSTHEIHNCIDLQAIEIGSLERRLVNKRACLETLKQGDFSLNEPFVKKNNVKINIYFAINDFCVEHDITTEDIMFLCDYSFQPNDRHSALIRHLIEDIHIPEEKLKKYIINQREREIAYIENLLATKKPEKNPAT
ncbi:MAG: hypothetical protein HQL22_02800 [Candidatus Omnitrophica bacterium]|nr:hypothetical protein [Candidatus Omnitrophota bacterium]